MDRTITFMAEIANICTIDAEEVTIRFNVDDVAVYEEEVKLSAGELCTSSFSWTATKGDYTISVEVSGFIEATAITVSSPLVLKLVKLTPALLIKPTAGFPSWDGFLAIVQS